MTALLSAFGLVLVAELGDKSMLLALALAARYRASWVLLAIAIDAAAGMAIAALIGGAAGALLPERAIALGSGALFLGFGVWTLLDSAGEESVRAVDERSALLVIGGLALAMFLAELGDKTQVAALSLSGLNPGARLGVWGGATAGMVAADAVAIYAGLRLHRALPARAISRGAGVLFIAFGLGAIIFAFR